MSSSSDPSCLFCKIIKGELRSFKLLETDFSYAFMDIYPLARGHALVIPKCSQVPADLHADSHIHPEDHGEKLHDIPDEYLADAMPVARKVAKAIGASDYNILQNNGAIAHQVVGHVHFHIIPKPSASDDQGLVIGWPHEKADMDDLKALSEELKVNLAEDGNRIGCIHCLETQIRLPNDEKAIAVPFEKEKKAWRLVIAGSLPKTSLSEGRFSGIHEPSPTTTYINDYTPRASPTLTMIPLIIGIGLATALFLAIRRIRPKPIPGIPHFPITSFWGDIPRLASDTIKYSTIFDGKGIIPEGIKEHGPIFQIFLGPVHKSVIFADAQEIEDALMRSRNKSLDANEIAIAAFSGSVPNGMIALRTNDMWRRHRRITSALMTSKYLTNMAPAISANARLLVQYWEEKIKVTKKHGARCFSCQNDFEYSSLDTVSEMISGSSLDGVAFAKSQLDAVKPVVDDHGGAIFSLASQPFFTSLRVLLGHAATAVNMPATIARIYNKVIALTPAFRRHNAFARRHLDGYIQSARRVAQEARALGEEPGTATSLIHMVVEKEGTPEQEQISDEELIDEAMTFLLGGHDTTSMALQWCVKYFTDAPDVQRILRKELLSALDNSPAYRPLTFADVNSAEKTPYLEAVLAEVLRCAWVSIGVGKTAKETVNILGHTIPAGVSMLIMTHLSSNLVTEENLPNLRSIDHLRSETSLKAGLGGRGLWKNPELFDPSRWLTEDGRFNPKAGFSLPFGVGPRACAGRALAQLELKIYIATLNLAFFFDEVPKELANYRAVQQVSRGPEKAYVAPRPWSDAT